MRRGICLQFLPCKREIDGRIFGEPLSGRRWIIMLREAGARRPPFFKGGLWGFGISDSNPVLIPCHSLAAPFALFRRGIQNSLSISPFLYCEVTIRV